MEDADAAVIAVAPPCAERKSHMEQLTQNHRKSMMKLFPVDGAGETTAVDNGGEEGGRGAVDEGAGGADDKESIELDSAFIRSLNAFLGTLGDDVVNRLGLTSMEVRLQNVTYRVPRLDDGTGGRKTMHTVFNSSPLYAITEIYKGLCTFGRSRPERRILVKEILSNVDLVLKPKRMYLVLGPPLSGKTSLLKAIAGLLPGGTFKSGSKSMGYVEERYVSGRIAYNNIVCSGEGADTSRRTLFRNLVAFVRQTDLHAPRLTVAETLLFSGRCKNEVLRNNNRGTSTDGRVGLTLRGLGLSHVQDTYVGNEKIRGVSGGQRRRVTLGEMLVFDTPLLCGDKISTGLDTASTVEILRILSFLSRVFSRISVVSLLQPSPEALSLFDEVILLSDGGHVIFAGPTENACEYFRGLGYAQPDSMDDADYLLTVAGPDRKHLCQGDSSEITSEFSPMENLRPEMTEGHQIGWEKDWAEAIENGRPTIDVDRFMKRYQNSFWTSVRLNLERSFVLWTRDRIFIRASLIKNIAMGLSVGFVFLNTDMNSSFFGVLFQGNLFIMLGAMTTSPEKLDDRAIFYKHDASNFYPALSYVIGQAIASIPQILIDVLLFGSFVYWLVGFVTSAKGFILYLALFFSFNLTCGQMFGVLASVAPSKTAVQAGGAFLLLLNVLFCGYIVSPTAIPDYYIWLYWTAPLAWVYRALLVNEFLSDDPSYADGVGDKILVANGFVLESDGEQKPFTREWIAYCFAYLFSFFILCMVTSAACLHFLHMEPEPNGSLEMPETEEKEIETDLERGTAPFIPVTLSFKDISYKINASHGSGQVCLLNNISGVFSAGRMCALMGESGAGKTTLMDIIALRKGSGNISGDVLLNGYLQEPISFKRCSGYVEQFDIQSAELTVRETILFSAQLRLDAANPVYDKPGGLDDHIDSIMEILELTREAEILVGNEDDGGLTFEQKKRLSIAVEMAASPSIIFLDEPTSGLDARAAFIVMGALRKMCDTGRTVVATIHQPSSTVFNMFDDLLLLKKGGEMVFFGELGACSCNLLAYFEALGATPMNRGENPATWMLNVLGEKVMVDVEMGEKIERFDFAKAWIDSSNYSDLRQRLAEATESQDEDMKIKYETEFAVNWLRRDNLMAHRLVTIYWRSPAYNLSRMILSITIALLLGSIFIPTRKENILSEAEITSMLSTIFIAFIVIGVLSITSVLPVMLSIRDMYYRHKAAGMLNSRSVGRALATAEKWFILLSSLLFCVVFLPLSGILNEPDETFFERFKAAFGFWGFFAFNTAIYSYIGQLFMCLVRGPGTAQILASCFIGINNFFSGLIVRPQQMTGFWQITYWINPGHFVYEGLVINMFRLDKRFVIVGEGSDYFLPLGCNTILVDGVCQVSVSTYVNAFFGGLFHESHLVRNACVLGGILALVRILTFVALRFLTYSGK